MGVEGLAVGAPGPEAVLHRQQGIPGDGVHFEVQRLRPADRQGAHHGGVVVAIGAGPLQGELVRVVEVAPTGVVAAQQRALAGADDELVGRVVAAARSEEHTSELPSLMRISYAVFCLKTKNYE